jgi:hypothetical protein
MKSGGTSNFTPYRHIKMPTYNVNTWTQDYIGPDQTPQDKEWVEQWWETYPWTWELDHNGSPLAMGHPIDRPSYCRKRIYKKRTRTFKPKRLWKAIKKKNNKQKID